MSLANAIKGAESIGEITRGYNSWLVKTEKDNHSHDDGRLHPSSLGGCPTSAAYSMIGFAQLFKPRIDAKAYRIFSVGTAIHQMLQAQFFLSGIICPDPEDTTVPHVEIPISISSLDLVGHCDGIITEKFTKWCKRAVLEIKSINSNAFKSLKAPKPEHVIQGTAYYMGLVEAGLIDSEDNELVFIYYAKDTSEIKEFHIRVTQKNKDDAIKRGKAIHELIGKYHEADEIPAPFYDNPNKPPCRYCQWASLCFDTLRRKDFIERVKNAKTEIKGQKPAKTPPKRPRRRRPRISTLRK
ncbi:MAG: hypothetical protein GF334_06490 [Candidatus Altiarchaeales archaeon]|nr:hypothetical protein [Candidatus Altiarchaeales archaeon]